MNTESQKTLKPTPESRHPPLEDAPIHTGTHGPKQEKCQETFLRHEKTG